MFEKKTAKTSCVKIDTDDSVFAMPSVSYVLGYEIATDGVSVYLYGMAHDGITYLISRNEGLKWLSTNTARYTTATGQSSWKSTQNVPFVADTDAAYGTVNTYFSDTTWTVTYDGVSHAGTLVYRWGDFL
ncbi:PREDICTED: uncharacterized protein LOC106816112 [Priapulus caudatus]|uniref:Uncharacterized protein LOC106816112 n=1 Tax=Priapulus caudatus TaxID=37621 RepID=A0ABM1EVD1_PRICU|nr:PREDICTED: uncharacterized protein LOC106816112 [Priapulus caudatus]